jgi:hypothetical protein
MRGGENYQHASIDIEHGERFAHPDIRLSIYSLAP